MDTTEQVREFLTTRRGRLTPRQAGLPAWGGHRRVTGLRREEVAMLAGMSVDYYTRLERGNLTGVSEQVLAAVAGALQLDEAERSHLMDLARTANTGPASRSRVGRPRGHVRREVRWILDSITTAPAMVRDERRDVLAVNALAQALYSPMYAGRTGPVNLARFTFLDPRAREFFLGWEQAAADLAASLRSVAGRNPDDRELADLIGELTGGSEDFARMWAEHDVRLHRSGLKGLRHPLVGEVHLKYESMDLPGDTGLSLIVYTAEPGSPTAAAMARLVEITGQDARASVDAAAGGIALP